MKPRRNGKHWLAITLLVVTAVLLVRAALIRDPALRVPPVIGYIVATVLLLGGRRC